MTDMMSNGPQSILRIAPVASADDSADKAPERLIPFVGQFVINVDKAGGKITVDWGLDY